MMYQTIKPDEMKALEQAWMRETGIPGMLLMEHAAQGVVAALKRYTDHGRVLFLCGPGSNGGDGYAAARLWQAAGGQSSIWELTDRQKGDAALNRSLCLNRDRPIRICTLDEQASLPDGDEQPDAVVDAMFGTGLSRPLEGTARELAARTELWRRSGVPVIAVDIPSGLDGTTGKALGVAVHADETVTFHRLKQGLVLGDSADHTGRLTVHPILIPAAYGAAADPIRVLTPDGRPLLPARRPGAHKGSFGKVVIFAGRMGMAGAAALCAKAAVRSGAGLTYILARASIVPVLQVLVPGAVCVPLPEQDGCLTAEAAAIAADRLRDADAAAVGCGLGQSDDLLPVLSAFREASCPVVWDADALNLLASQPSLLPLPARHAMTPHPGEAARLLGCATGEVLFDARAALHRLHDACGCHVLLKGARTLMTDGCYDAANITGSPAMAKGGSGDILTGIITALAAQQGTLTLETLQQAALVHGMAGIRAGARYGESHVLPEQLTDCIRFDEEGMKDQ